MIVYHGTMDRYAEDIQHNGILLTKSKEFLNFGKGFYTTPDFNFAFNTACLKANRNNEHGGVYANPAILKFEFNEKVDGIIRKSFDGYNNEWKRFVLHNRLGVKYIEQYNLKGHNIDCKYDIVCGETADGDISSLILNIKRGNVEINNQIYELIDIKRPKIWGTQVSFHTSKSLTCINMVGCDIIRLEKE